MAWNWTQQVFISWKNFPLFLHWGVCECVEGRQTSETTITRKKCLSDARKFEMVITWRALSLSLRPWRTMRHGNGEGGNKTDKKATKYWMTKTYDRTWQYQMCAIFLALSFRRPPSGTGSTSNFFHSKPSKGGASLWIFRGSSCYSQCRSAGFRNNFVK